MKTQFFAPFRRALLALGLATLTPFALHADEDGTTAIVKLSAPGKPSSLKIDMPWADIHIFGADTDKVTVKSTLNQKGGKDTREDGLRRLDDEVSFELHEHDNVVSLSVAGENPWATNDGDFKIWVPRAMTLDVKTGTGGDLVISDVAGDIEVNNMNGEVRLEGIAGSAVVNTLNGEVHAIYATPPQKLVSITSMNGEIDLRVPAETKANVRLRTHNGSILTDFDDTVLKTKSENRNLGDSPALSNDSLTINIRKNGEYSLGSDLTPLSFEKLTEALSKVPTADKGMPITIRTDENTDLKYVTAAMDACRTASLNKIRLQSGFSEAAAARMGADAARAAADTARAAAQAAQEYARAIQLEVERATIDQTEIDRAISSADSNRTPRAPRVPRAPRPPVPPITGGKLVSGTLNGGGVDIKISTMNGEITLRRNAAFTVSTTMTGGLRDGSMEPPQQSDLVTVDFQNPDNFTDIRESRSNLANMAGLDELRDYVQKTAAPLLPAGRTLRVTFIDLDFAGDIRPDKDNVRVMTATTIPRAHLKFQLLNASGKVIKEGERKLSDSNYQGTTQLSGRDDPLFYDKQLLKDWITKEFKTHS